MILDSRLGPARRYRPPAPPNQTPKTPAPPRRHATAAPRTTPSKPGKFAPFTQPQSAGGDQSSLEPHYNASAGPGIVQKNNSPGILRQGLTAGLNYQISRIAWSAEFVGEAEPNHVGGELYGVVWIATWGWVEAASVRVGAEASAWPG